MRQIIDKKWENLYNLEIILCFVDYKKLSTALIGINSGRLLETGTLKHLVALIKNQFTVCFSSAVTSNEFRTAGGWDRDVFSSHNLTSMVNISWEKLWKMKSDKIVTGGRKITNIDTQTTLLVLVKKSIIINRPNVNKWSGGCHIHPYT